MDQFAGLDVSVKETSVCIVDDTVRIVREVKVASEPEALLQILENPIYRFKRIGLEAGPLSQWLFNGLAAVIRTGRERWGARQRAKPPASRVEPRANVVGDLAYRMKSTVFGAHHHLTQTLAAILGRQVV